MRYLIFNITVLSALGYLFMASPEQSFTSWVGKAPQMYDAAKTAGRDGVAGSDSSETAGTALLEAIEPVVEEVLSSPKAPTPEQMPVGSWADAPLVEASNMQTAEAAQMDVDAGRDVEPVTIQDIAPFWKPGWPRPVTGMMAWLRQPRLSRRSRRRFPRQPRRWPH
jgi:hypothetical protein